ncbi:uncharacterized protein [Rutidosis leptorrhynchoides]|uniref:uncharacterized protein n=1 Tax=Rutidosis leptorrhynchoides TaxID=125765 RepID=UPI003A994EDE
MYNGVKVGVDKVVVSHLQYADDTIFSVNGVEKNARNLMLLLECFERTSGLKVYYNKSNLLSVGVDASDVSSLADCCGCQPGVFLFTYLGLPVGSKIKKLNDWSPVSEKCNKRLADWRARTDYFGGRLTLVKSILSSLPLYYFLLFRAPPCVLKKLECVHREFFWGGSGNNKKLSRVKWEKLLHSHEEGWLNIMSLNCKKLALLCFEVDKLGIPFSNFFKKRIEYRGKGEARVRDRVQQQGEEYCFSLAWAIDPVGRTCAELEDICGLIIAGCSFSDGPDHWIWSLDSYDKFTVKKT